MSATLRLVPPGEWPRLTPGEQAAANALTFHLVLRSQQTTNPAFEGDDCVFLTVSHVQRLLRATSAANTGEKAAAAALRVMQERGWIVDTKETKKPRRPPQSLARAEHFNGPTSPEGGRDSQPTLSRSYWWRIFRVPALTRVVKASKPLGAYGRFVSLPHHEACLSAFLICQGLISRPNRGKGGNPGSVQWAFHHSGPP